MPVRSDTNLSFVDPHLQAGFPALLFALSHCGESDLAPTREQARDLALQSLLVKLNHKEQVGSLGGGAREKAFGMRRVSA